MNSRKSTENNANESSRTTININCKRFLSPFGISHHSISIIIGETITKLTTTIHFNKKYQINKAYKKLYRMLNIPKNQDVNQLLSDNNINFNCNCSEVQKLNYL